MKLTADPKRIDEAHYILQRLEDEVVGDMVPVLSQDMDRINQVFKSRLEAIHTQVWRAIRCLNEGYDK